MSTDLKDVLAAHRCALAILQSSLECRIAVAVAGERSTTPRTWVGRITAAAGCMPRDQAEEIVTSELDHYHEQKRKWAAASRGEGLSHGDSIPPPYVDTDLTMPPRDTQ